MGNNNSNGMFSLQPSGGFNLPFYLNESGVTYQPLAWSTDNIANFTVAGFNLFDPSVIGQWTFTGATGNVVMSGASNLSLNINSPTGMLKINSTKVLGPQDTGWLPVTGTPSKTGYNTATVTLAQVAATLMAVENVLRTHGLIN